MERAASFLGLLVTIGRYLFLFLLYRFLWQLFQATGQMIEDQQEGEYLLEVTDLSSPGSSQRYRLEGQLTVGRDLENKIILDDPYSSGKHLRIWQQGEQCFLEDLESTNGTLLGGKPVPHGVPVEIQPGDKIMIGTTQLSMQKEPERSFN